MIKKYAGSEEIVGKRVERVEGLDDEGERK